ncbi:MAG: glycosyltransferase family 2 protein [Firmicutes bacterium]|nr:glycosyltransferase family 2 protein [Bacillota bacterium]
MQPLLSIIMPIYNNERTLKKAVDSILVQKFDNWELLLVDDGSTDSCVQIVEDYAKSDIRIKAFHKKNGGMYSACNCGLEQAIGKYITFCCADDTYEPIAFEIIKVQLDDYDYDMVFIACSSNDCDNDQNIIFTYPYENKITNSFKITDKKTVEMRWFDFLVAELLMSPINVYKSSIIKKYRFREDYYISDRFMNNAIADEIHSVSYNPIEQYKHYKYINIVDSNVNISMNKYYDYEMDMLIDQYLDYTNLFAKWGLLDKVLINFANLTIQGLAYALTKIFAFNNKNATTTNIDIVTNYYNDIIFETAAISDSLLEVDNEIFKTILTIIQTGKVPANFDNPVVRMITAINSTTMLIDEVKLEIANGLLDYRNPYRIGFETYKNLSDKYPQLSNPELLAYLQTEQTARKLLFTGNLEKALDTVIQLFNSKISTPEQYVILTLCGYHLGLTEYAKNAVETGLKNFPNYPRLEELQNIINERND